MKIPINITSLELKYLQYPINYTLYKEFKLNSIKKILIPSPIEKVNTEINLNNIKNKYKKQTNEFINIFLKNTPLSNRNIFYKNINTLSINEIDFLNDKGKISKLQGNYDIKNNSITIIKEQEINPIYHELFHMTSSYESNNAFYSGFRQFYFYKNKFIDIGNGLNEGYTQALTERYFRNKDIFGTYPYEVLVANCLEMIIGEDIMKECYFNANLPKLIEEIKKYSLNLKDIISFIYKLDCVSEHINDIKMNNSKKLLLENYIKDIDMFLLDSYITKLKNNVDNNILSNDEFQINLVKMLDLIVCRIKYENLVFHQLSLEEVESYLKEALNNPTLSLKYKESI